MKRIWIVLIAAVFMLLVCACGEQSSSDVSGGGTTGEPTRVNRITSNDDTEPASAAGQTSSAYSTNKTKAATQKTLTREEQKRLKEEMDRIIDELMGAD